MIIVVALMIVLLQRLSIVYVILDTSYRAMARSSISPDYAD